MSWGKALIVEVYCAISARSEVATVTFTWAPLMAGLASLPLAVVAPLPQALKTPAPAKTPANPVERVSNWRRVKGGIG